MAALPVLAHDDAGKSECMAFELHHGWSLRASSEALHEHCTGIFATAQQTYHRQLSADFPETDDIESVA